MTLYLGLRPPPDGAVIHYPVIRTERIDSEELQEALRLWPRITHVFFTSRSAVIHWWEGQSEFGDKVAIAIGKGTAQELKWRGVESLVAPEAVQEGVIALLETLSFSKDAYFLYPRSERARPLLCDYFVKGSIPCFTFDLYETIFQRIEPVPSLSGVDEIVFTSPSTVEGFLRIYGALPKGIRLTPIGPITQARLQEEQQTAL